MKDALMQDINARFLNTVAAEYSMSNGSPVIDMSNIHDDKYLNYKYFMERTGLLGWNQKISALRNAMVDFGKTLLAYHEEHLPGWEMAQQRGLASQLYRQEDALKSTDAGISPITQTKGLTPTTSSKQIKAIPYIKEFHVALKVWKNFNDYCLKYQNMGKHILDERRKSKYYNEVHNIFKKYGVIHLVQNDCEELQKKEVDSENHELSEGQKYRQYASLSTLTNAILAVSRLYPYTKLIIHCSGKANVTLKELVEKRKKLKLNDIEILENVDLHKCIVCGSKGEEIEKDHHHLRCTNQKCGKIYPKLEAKFKAMQEEKSTYMHGK